jgi:hypothetical protein
MFLAIVQYASPGLSRRFYASVSRLLVLSIWLLVLPSAIVAAEGEPFEVQTASFSLEDSFLKLDLEVNIDLPDFIGIAVNQGLAVPFMFEVEIFTSRNYWVDKKIVTVKQAYLLHFLPMLSSYVVNDINAGKRHYFDSLDEAVEHMEAVFNYPMLDIGNFDFNREFYARARFRIDHEALPLPLKPSFFWPSDWDERSKWFSFEMVPLSLDNKG